MKRIFIDPGHGGNDPGAIGNGLQEKGLNLSIALALKEILNENYSSHVVKLSRETDRTVSLRERTTMANNWQADFLISIHVNAGGGTGFESFVYNNPKMRKRETKQLQSVIHREIIKETRFVNRGTKEANFHMLRESRMPALLTESGFIDQQQDARLLKDKKFIRKIANGHAKGLVAALQLSKRFVTHTRSNKYVIKKGDTLWSIAKRYGTSVKRLRQLNPSIEPRSLPIGYELVIFSPSTKEHIITKGDTLWSLALTYNTTVKELQLLNPHIKPRQLQIGQITTLP